jgi:nucleoside-diphosphate-sugar epimerase
LIHISGTGILNDFSNGFGNPTAKVYDDLGDIKEITSLPETALHRDVDEVVITSGIEHKVPTAIFCPPMIYGIGQGPLKKRSIQVPNLIEAILKRGRAFTVGEGKNIWDRMFYHSKSLEYLFEAVRLIQMSDIHVDDLAKAFVLLVEEALKPNGGSATWGQEGYYFVESGDFAWKDISYKIAEILNEKKQLETPDVDQLSVDEASKLHPWAPVLWGGNCRSRASRLRSLGWKPTGPTVAKCLPSMIESETLAV